MADSIEGVIDLVPWEVREPENIGGMGHSIIANLIQLDTFMPAHWSRARDIRLAQFARESDPLKIAITTFISKASNVPLLLVPRDRTVQSHVELAEVMTEALDMNSGFGRGFAEEYKRFIFDWLTQDNGAFMMILGHGRLTGPIIGRASGVVHLASYRCTRISDPIYPVLYLHTDGILYKIHYTRIISMVNLPQPDPELRGVGMCPVTLCLDSARELHDIAVFMQEKLGSRPARQILYAKTGARVEEIRAAILEGDMLMRNERLTRFAKTLLLGPKNASGKLELDTIDLASVPDGFDRQSDTLLAMATIAAAFGLDLRDLAYSFGISGQTRSDAQIQHLKGLGKGVAEFADHFAKLLTIRFLPKSLVAAFDYVDDSQDEASAKITSQRSASRTRDLMGAVLSPRVAREHMLRYGELTINQFEELELMDGRLPDGTSILSLFFSTEEPYSVMLSLGIDDPTDIQGNSIEAVQKSIRNQLKQTYIILNGTTGAQQKKKFNFCIAALEWLGKKYEERRVAEEEAAQQEELALNGRSAGIRTKPQKIGKQEEKSNAVQD